MKKLSVTVLMSLLIVGLATAAFSWGGGHGGCGRGPGYGPCADGSQAALAGLNLTAEQKEKLNAMKEERFKQTKPLMDKMFAKRGDLKLLWLDKNPDQEKIMAAQKELRKLRDEMQDKMTAYRLEVLKVLTPEQQSKMRSSMVGGLGRGHGMGFGPGMGGGPGGCPGGGPSK